MEYLTYPAGAGLVPLFLSETDSTFSPAIGPETASGNSRFAYESPAPFFEA
jgi:hypothetical protein